MRARPVLIYDGDCGFCTLWAKRWERSASGRVEVVPASEIAWQYPEIPAQEFQSSVQWIGRDGVRRRGAEAVFYMAAEGGIQGRFLVWLHRRVTLFRVLTEFAYGFVARNRSTFSWLTRLLFGGCVEIPEYRIASFLFLRGLGLIYLIAFLSIAVQWKGLFGSRGILPAAELFGALNRQGLEWFGKAPSLFWLHSGDAFLAFCCAAGVLLSGALVVGAAPRILCVILWVLHLSFVVAGQVFFQFQWDSLLLEVGFLAIFLAPSTIRPTLSAPPPPRVARWLLVWLLFRLLFSSGVVKLSSGDPMWAGLTALQDHFFTQPIPNPLSWFANLAPPLAAKVGAVTMFFAELVLPFFVFLPRNGRKIALLGIVALQGVIFATGNYGYFNLLSVLLAVLLIDDRMWPRGIWQRVRPTGDRPPRGAVVAAWVVGIPLLVLSIYPLQQTFRKERTPFDWLESPFLAAAPFRVVNGYGLFAVMTPGRPEIIVQGSEDGIRWETYVFRFKPGPLDRMPPQVAPYMPRLDWQMWFAALGTPEQSPWFLRLCEHLLRGSPDVLALLESNPFPQTPPRFIRAQLDDYRFTTPAERSQTGAWWESTPRATFLPAVRLTE